MSLADGGDGVRAGIADGRYCSRDNSVTPGPPPSRRDRARRPARDAHSGEHNGRSA
jgi:hypothetical protein